MADTRHQDQDPDQPVPRDLPDQQVQQGGDYLDIPPPPSSDEPTGESEEPAEEPAAEAADPDEVEDTDDQRLPEVDQAGAGQGEPRSGSVHPEQPVPDEPTG